MVAVVRHRLRSGVLRLRSVWLAILQTAVAACLAWFLAVLILGPPLHVHHNQQETIHALKGRYKVQIGEETFHLAEGGFAYLPSRIPHAFLNLTDDPGEIVVVYVPGGGHKFYEELGPLMRNGTPDHATVAALFEKYDMTVLGPPLSAD